MSIDLIVTLTAAFLFVALVAGYGTSALVSATSADRRRLRQLATSATGPMSVIDTRVALLETVDPRLKRIPGVPKSPKELGRLRRRLARAGYTSITAVVIFAAATILTPCALALLAISLLGAGQGWILAVIGAAIGYLIPSLVLGRLTELRKREIREGLPDALDLFIVCVEAGCGLDQAIMKASDELGLTYPALTYELRVFVFAPHHAPLHLRLELLDRQGRRVGSSRRVTLPAGQNTRPIRVRLKRGIVVRRPAFGWRIRVRAWRDRTAGVLTLPTRP